MNTPRDYNLVLVKLGGDNALLFFVHRINMLSEKVTSPCGAYFLVRSRIQRQNITKRNHSVLDGDTCCGKEKQKKMVNKFRENSGVGTEEGSG